ncbi:MAG TPA: hypothetical protein VHB97_26170 [Polyangia bacterium]|nr:hypothetical protein [Polyangia bacterium]
MPKPFDKWTVFPHQPIEKLEDNLWRVEGKVDQLRRVMVVVRLGDGRLVIWNGIALDEPEMKELEAWGTPTFLIVPNGFHRLDARIWKQRYPGLTVIAPPGAKKKIEEIVAVDGTDGDLGDAAVTLTFPACTSEREALLEVKHAGGTTVVINDLVMNMRHGPGFGGFMFRMMGFTGDKPKVAPATKLLLVKNKPGLKTLLQQLAATPDLKRVIVSHGDPIADAPAEALRHAATF